MDKELKGLPMSRISFAGHDYILRALFNELIETLEKEREVYRSVIEFNMYEWERVHPGYRDLTAWQKCRDALKDE